MTVCVGLKLPCPGLVKGFGAGIHGPELVVLASDSRLTNTYKNEWSDDGEKLFQFCANGMYAYAGSTLVGEGLITELLVRRFPTFGRLTPDLWLQNFTALDLLADGLRYVHQRATKKHGLSPEQARVWILAASADEHQVRLVRFDTGTPGDPYRPFEINGGVRCIGAIEALTEVRDTCERIIQSQTRYDDNPTFWATKVVMATDRVVRSKAHKTVGGLVQTAVLTPENGVQFISHALMEWNEKTGNYDAPTTTDISGSSWTQRQGEREIGKTRGHLPFADFPSPVDPKNEGEGQTTRFEQVNILPESDFAVWVVQRVSDILQGWGWAVANERTEKLGNEIIAVKGDRRWLVHVNGVRGPIEPEVQATERENLCIRAREKECTPIMALYWFHDPDGNRLFRHAGEFYEAVNPEK